MGRKKNYITNLRKIGFKMGYVPHNAGVQLGDTHQETKSPKPQYIRLPQDQYEMVYREPSELVREQQAKAHPPMLLRPRKRRETELDRAQVPENVHAEMDTYRLLNPQKTSNLWNEAIREHRTYHPQCTGSLIFDESAEVKRGLAWKERLKCES